MKRRLAVFLAVAAATAVGGLAAARVLADDSPSAPAADAARAAKTEKVRTLLRLQGGEQLAKMTLDKMLDQFKQMPGLPPGFIEKFREKADVKQLMELALPAYVSHLDDATLDATVAFYESPAGKALAGQLPAIAMESMDAGAAWGRKVASDVVKELQK